MPETTQTHKPPLTVLLAAPRGFCAGVTRAIHAVEHALDRFGKPVYVRHEIVHNRRVVKDLADKGAVFISELREAPPDSPVITSAHGVARAVADDARARGLLHIDATCPLVEKVHSEVRRHIARDRQVILVGHRDHPEVTGTLGQAPAGRVLLVETKADCRAVTPDDPARLAWATQTTLSVGDTAEMIRILESRFPEIQGPKKSDICYATENRQNAVAAAAPECELFLVIGSANSSNSQRLVEVARAAGCPRSLRIDGAGELPPPRDLEGVRTLGLTAGASAPEELVREVLDALARDFSLTTEERQVAEERIHFQPPRVLRQNTRVDGDGDSRGGGEGVGDGDSDGDGEGESIGKGGGDGDSRGGGESVGNGDGDSRASSEGIGGAGAGGGDGDNDGESRSIGEGVGVGSVDRGGGDSDGEGEGESIDKSGGDGDSRGGGESVGNGDGDSRASSEGIGDAGAGGGDGDNDGESRSIGEGSGVGSVDSGVGGDSDGDGDGAAVA